MSYDYLMILEILFIQSFIKQLLIFQHLFLLFYHLSFLLYHLSYLNFQNFLIEVVSLLILVHLLFEVILLLNLIHFSFYIKVKIFIQLFQPFNFYQVVYLTMIFLFIFISIIGQYFELFQLNLDLKRVMTNKFYYYLHFELMLMANLLNQMMLQLNIMFILTLCFIIQYQVQ